MNYLTGMVKDFVFHELSKEHGRLLDETELLFSYGLICQLLVKKSDYETYQSVLIVGDTIADTHSTIVNKLYPLLSQQSKELPVAQKLYSMIEQFEPSNKKIDSVLIDLFLTGLKEIKIPSSWTNAPKKQSNVICKTYKLNKVVVDDFAKACEKDGVKLGPKLTELMQAYICQVLDS